MGDLVPLPNSELAPVSRLRAELEEAKAEKSLPRLQRVIGAATVAAEAQRRVAKLADGHGSPVEVVDAAREASRQAATVQLEATAEAGRILKEMAENGQRQAHGQAGTRAMNQTSKVEAKDDLPPTLADLGIPHVNANRWQKIGDIPDEVRERYIYEASAEDRDVTAAGLLRYAAPPKEKTDEEETPIREAYQEVMRLLPRLTNYRAAAIAAYASESRNKTKFKQEIERLAVWLDRVRDIIK